MVNLVCPRGHRVEGMPRRYAGTKRPPDAWFEKISREFWRLIRAHPPEPCSECGATFNPNSSDRKHLEKWGIAVDELKATTMKDAVTALKTCAVVREFK